MKVDNCYICGSREHSFFAEENGFRLVKCKGCGLLFVADRPDDSEISKARMQGIHGGIKKIDTTGSFNPGKIVRYSMVLKELFGNDLKNKKTWLDIGCGYGEFMEAVKSYGSGVSIKGTEPNIRKRESAVERGLNVEFFDIEGHKEKYDVVSMLNVYSHLPDPPEFINTLKSILKPEGELILETGDTANFSARDHCRPFYLPDHLSFASEGIIRRLLEKLGFKILSIKKYPLVRFSLSGLLKELARAIATGSKSRIRCYLNAKKYSRVDMFIRARLT